VASHAACPPVAPWTGRSHHSLSLPICIVLGLTMPFAGPQSLLPSQHSHLSDAQNVPSVSWMRRWVSVFRVRCPILDSLCTLPFLHPGTYHTVHWFAICLIDCSVFLQRKTVLFTLLDSAWP
jgi:hypothetical protein